VILALSAVAFTGCDDEETTDLKGNMVTDANSTTDEAGNIRTVYLDDTNCYSEYAEDDEERVNPIAVYQCNVYGAIQEKDFYTYDKKGNPIKQVHYEGTTLDYTQVNEYDKNNNNTKIITYAGTENRNNLTETLVIKYNKNNNIIKTMAYDSDNALDNYDETSYVTINGVETIKKNTSYDASGNVVDKTVYSYRQDGTTKKDVYTLYSDGEVYYTRVTGYDADGIANSYTYYDADGNEIENPEEETE
jgi:hypothetical protein